MHPALTLNKYIPQIALTEFHERSTTGRAHSSVQTHPLSNFASTRLVMSILGIYVHDEISTVLVGAAE